MSEIENNKESKLSKTIPIFNIIEDYVNNDGNKQSSVLEAPKMIVTEEANNKKEDSNEIGIELKEEMNKLNPYDNINLKSKTPSLFPLPNGPQMASNPLQKARQKIAVEPGHSPLDWARLMNSNVDLRGVDSLQPISLAQLKTHNTEQDAWMALFGKVYNISSYLKFHPGGVKQLMKGAGKDATKLYNKVHPWVNAESLLSKCLVGFLVD